MEHLTIKAGGEDEKHSERTTFKHQNLLKMEVSPSKNDEAWCFHHQNVWKTYVKLLNS